MSFKRRIADLVARALDVHIVPRRATAWPEQRFAAALLADLGIDCVLDVGANVGQYAGELRRLGFTGTILSFEPGPTAFAALSAAAASDPEWHVFNHALGAAEGTLPFNVMKATEMSSFLQPATRAGDMFADVNVIEHILEVPVRTLAGVLAELKARHGFAAPFLKLDTQGFDLEVIRGAGAALGEIRAVLSEVSVKRLYAGAPMAWDSLEALSEAGYDLVGMYSVHPGNIRDPHEFNCYVLRRDLASAHSAG